MSNQGGGGRHPSTTYIFRIQLCMRRDEAKITNAHVECSGRPKGGHRENARGPHTDIFAFFTQGRAGQGRAGQGKKGSMSSSAPTPPKLRLLCLHGYLQNSEVCSFFQNVKKDQATIITVVVYPSLTRLSRRIHLMHRV